MSWSINTNLCLCVYIPLKFHFIICLVKDQKQEYQQHPRSTLSSFPDITHKDSLLCLFLKIYCFVFHIRLQSIWDWFLFMVWKRRGQDSPLFFYMNTSWLSTIYWKAQSFPSALQCHFCCKSIMWSCMYRSVSGFFSILFANDLFLQTSTYLYQYHKSWYQVA